MPYEIPACVGKPYLPSNGTEGDMFRSQFCWRCARDAKYRETQDGADGCPIHTASFVEENGPKEWTHDERGRPICTAFEPEEAK